MQFLTWFSRLVLLSVRSATLRTDK